MINNYRQYGIQYLVLILILCLTNISFAQTARIFSSKDGSPVEGVFIFNKTQTDSQISNYKGKFSIKDFSEDDILFFQHPSFQPLELSVNQITVLGNTILLDEKTIMLDEILISANKWEQKRSEISNKISQITSKEIDFVNPQNAADLIESSGEVFVQKSQMGGGSPMIRGFAANALLLVFDGVRMNNAIYRSGNLQNIITIDPNIVETSEIIFGPGTVIYGSDALGGVIAFKSKQAALSFTDDHFSANFMARYNSANQEKSSHIDINFGYRKFASYTSISFSRFGNQKMGKYGPDAYLRNEYTTRINNRDTIIQNANPRIQMGTAYSQVNLMQKFRFRPNDHWDVNLSVYFTNSSDIPRYDRLIQYKGDRLKYADWYYGPQTWTIQNLNIKHHQKKLLYDNLKLTLSNQFYQESRHDRKFGKSELRSRTETVNALSLNVDAEKKISKKETIYYGLETVYNHITSEGILKNIYTNTIQSTSSRYPDSLNYLFSTAIYSSYKKSLNEKLFINTGLRFNNSNLISKLSTTTSYSFPFNEIILRSSSLNGSIGFAYLINTSSQLTMNIGSGFRAPNLDDIAKVFDSEPGFVIVPNKNLKPEYIYSTDFGIYKDINEYFGFETTAFMSYLHDAMVRKDFTFDGQDSILYDGELSRVQALVNTSYAYIAGISAKSHIQFNKKLRLDINANFIYGRDNENQPLRHVPPAYGTAKLSYQGKKIKSTISAIYNGKIRAENLAKSEKSKTHIYLTNENGETYSPSWWVVNWNNSYIYKKRYTFHFGINNILNKRYRPYSSGIVAPGRSVSIAIKVKI